VEDLFDLIFTVFAVAAAMLIFAGMAWAGHRQH
jgi:hypothetical protein